MHIHFVIRPNVALIETLANEDIEQDIKYLLLVSQHWTEPNKYYSQDIMVNRINSEWVHERRCLLFLAHLYELYVLDNLRDNISKKILDLFKPLPLTMATFNRWWVIEYFEIYEDTDEIINDLSHEAWDVIGKTEIKDLDYWIAEHKKMSDQNSEA